MMALRDINWEANGMQKANGFHCLHATFPGTTVFDCLLVMIAFWKTGGVSMTLANLTSSVRWAIGFLTNLT